MKNRDRETPAHRVLVRMPENMMAHIRFLADDNGLSVAEVIRHYVSLGMKVERERQEHAQHVTRYGR